jgi:hypothetical protein
VFSVVDAEKLWLLWPATPENLDVFYGDAEQQHRRLPHLVSRLKHGTYAITSKGAAIYLPPGMLHATYALEGGAIVGVQWSSAESLDMASQITAREVASTLQFTHEAQPFLEAIMSALKIGKRLEVCQALSRICPAKTRQDLKRLEKSTADKEVKELCKEVKGLKYWDGSDFDRTCGAEGCNDVLSHLPF